MGRKWTQSRDDAGGLMGRSGGAPKMHTQILSIMNATCTVAATATVQEKPVESQTMMPAVPSLTVTGGSSATGNFQNIPKNAFGNTQGTVPGTDQPQYHLDSISYGIPSKEYRYVEGIKSEGGEHGLFSEALSLWALMPGSFCTSKSSNSCMLQSESESGNSFLSYGASASGEGVKLQTESLGPLWSKSRESWSGLEDKMSNSNQTAFSTSSTQLSVSIPISSSDFSATSS